MPERATTTIVKAAFAALDGDAELSGRGTRERAHPWQDADLPRWLVAWDGEQRRGRLGGAYEATCDIIFIAQAMGEGANDRVDGWAAAAEAALAGSGGLGGIVTSLRLAEAGREADDAGKAIDGTVRLRFEVFYETSATGILIQ